MLAQNNLFRFPFKDINEDNTNKKMIFNLKSDKYKEYLKKKSL